MGWAGAPARLVGVAGPVRVEWADAAAPARGGALQLLPEKKAIAPGDRTFLRRRNFLLGVPAYRQSGVNRSLLLSSWSSGGHG